MRESGALISAILRVAHPNLYRAGREALRSAAEANANIMNALSYWPTVFHSLQVISNRETPYHRDVSGEAEWMDLLISLGSYRQATLALRNVGMQVAYKPGSVVLLSGKIVHHGVSRVEPDRLCYAWYMTDALHRNFGGHDVSWVNRHDDVI